MSHTPEPWRLETGEGVHHIIGPHDPAIGNPSVAFQCVYGRGVGHRDHIEECAANARRIVAAVNACAGIPTEALEADVVRRMRETMQVMADILEGDCGVDPCVGSSAPAEHYLGVARAFLAEIESQ